MGSGQYLFIFSFRYANILSLYLSWPVRLLVYEGNKIFMIYGKGQNLKNGNAIRDKTVTKKMECYKRKPCIFGLLVVLRWRKYPRYFSFHLSIAISWKILLPILWSIHAYLFNLTLRKQLIYYILVNQVIILRKRGL